jgi:antirestriction protein ArdC
VKPVTDRQAYAREVIVAELASFLTAAQLGIAPASLDDQAANLASWVQAMKEDDRYVLSAASRARAAADHLKSFQPQS